MQSGGFNPSLMVWSDKPSGPTEVHLQYYPNFGEAMTLRRADMGGLEEGDSLGSTVIQTTIIVNYSPVG